MQKLILAHFISILQNNTPYIRPQTPPAPPNRKRRQGNDDNSEDNCITIGKAYYDGIIELASVALFEACYGRTKPEMLEWVENMNKKINDAAAGKPPPKKTKQPPSSSHPPLTDKQLKRMDIDAIRRDLNYTIPGLFLEIRKLKGDGNQHNRFSSFDYTGKELDD